MDSVVQQSLQVDRVDEQRVIVDGVVYILESREYEWIESLVSTQKAESTRGQSSVDSRKQRARVDRVVQILESRE